MARTRQELLKQIEECKNAIEVYQKYGNQMAIQSMLTEIAICERELRNLS